MRPRSAIVVRVGAERDWLPRRCGNPGPHPRRHARYPGVESCPRRRLPESNRCKRLCRPLRSHSAKAPGLTCGTPAGSGKRLMGFEPTTFCMASRRSSQLSYSRMVAMLPPAQLVGQQEVRCSHAVLTGRITPKRSPGRRVSCPLPPFYKKSRIRHETVTARAPQDDFIRP